MTQDAKGAAVVELVLRCPECGATTRFSRAEAEGAKVLDCAGCQVSVAVEGTEGLFASFDAMDRMLEKPW